VHRLGGPPHPQPRARVHDLRVGEVVWVEGEALPAMARHFGEQLRRALVEPW
jgi:hypothetical protein